MAEEQLQHDRSDCVEIGRGVGIRDSKAPAVHLPVEVEAWEGFLRLVTGD